MNAMCGIQFKDNKRYADQIVVFGLIEIISLLAMENSVH